MWMETILHVHYISICDCTINPLSTNVTHLSVTVAYTCSLTLCCHCGQTKPRRSDTFVPGS